MILLMFYIFLSSSSSGGSMSRMHVLARGFRRNYI